MNFQDTIDFIKNLYKAESFLPLHEPRFYGNERQYVNECIDTAFVSSVGKFVDTFENKVAEFTGAKYAIATVNGTSALHISLALAGVESNDEVITQPLTFIATCNAISYLKAHPVFIDVDKHTLGLSPEKLDEFFKSNTKQINNQCVNKYTKRVIKAVVPMHTFGLPIDMNHMVEVCNAHKVIVVEDAAESLGSYFNNKHTGTFGLLGTLSFNGNKTITTGGGGMILTNDQKIAKKAKHLTTTAKVPHSWEYVHDMIGYNYRMPNINAALGCAQIEMLPSFLKNKRETAHAYKAFFKSKEIHFITESNNTVSNYWLNAIQLKNEQERDLFLYETNNNNVMTRPIWRLINTLEMFKNCQTFDIKNAIELEKTIVNIPSSVRI